MRSLRVTTPRRSRPAMFPRWLVAKTMTPEMKHGRPYLRRQGTRAHMLWVHQLQRKKPRSLPTGRD